jgi:hypothetical protein
MLAAALLLLAQNPGLHHIHLVWVTAKAWKQSGNYTVHSREDATDVPCSLEVEKGARAHWGARSRDDSVTCWRAVIRFRKAG